ncbi:MAG TPA: VWA domain-containing protein [Polyangia bacterium]|nr:VWA domain-containing protein [Polyangia bacterium]
MSAIGAGTRLGFEHPAWLLLLFATPLLWVALRRSLADFPPRQLALQGALRTLLLAGVAAGLAGPTLRRPVQAVSATLLLDVSDSVSEAGLNLERRAATALIRAAARRGDPPPRLVRFAERPEEIPYRLGAPPELARFPTSGGAGTDLAMAVDLGAGLVDAGGLPRLLLISDGLPTRGDLAATARHLAERGLPLFALPLPPPDAGDAAIAELSAPDEVRPRVPFQIDVRVLSDRAAQADLRLQADGQATVDRAERTVSLAAGETTIAFTARVPEPARTVFRAHLDVAGDRHPENDDGVLVIAPQRDARALVLEGTPGAASSLPRALAAQRIAAEVQPARAFGAEPATKLAAADLLILADVPRAALADAVLVEIENFVRAGGGLLVTGGTQSFGPGGYLETPLETLLPVRLDLPERQEEAPLALALVIDRSGSMGGPKMELTKEAARATAETLPPADQIAVIVFDSQAQAVVPLQRAENRQHILGDIGRITASGGTNILAGLREAVEELLPVRARKKHIILLSDGQSPYDEIPDLVDAASAARITISAIGVGEGADQTMLKGIATRGGGRFYETRDPASIPRIFSRETADLGDQSIVERPTAVRVGKRTAALAGVAIESAPPLGGYVVTRPRAQAETLLTTGDGTPLLARWQVGLGTVTAWTSDLGARWGAAWARWPPYDKLWAQLARTTMRRRAASHFPIRAARRGDRVTLTVDAVGGDDRFLGGLDGRVEVTAAGTDGRAISTRSLTFPETAPGRYETSFRPDVESGALLFSASFTQAGAPVADASGRLTLPFAPELMPHPAGSTEGVANLAAAVARSGGRVVSDPTEVLDPGGERRETRQSIRAPILLVTLALFVVDVLFRRVRLPDAPSAIDSRR